MFKNDLYIRDLAKNQFKPAPFDESEKRISRRNKAAINPTNNLVSVQRTRSDTRKQTPWDGETAQRTACTNQFPS